MGRFNRTVKLAMLFMAWTRTILYAYDLFWAEGETECGERGLGSGERGELGSVDGGESDVEGAKERRQRRLAMKGTERTRRPTTMTVGRATSKGRYVSLASAGSVM